MRRQGSGGFLGHGRLRGRLCASFSAGLLLALAPICVLQAQQEVSPAEMEAGTQASDAVAPAAAAAPSPARVARLSFLTGEVRVQRTDNTADDVGVLNMPLGEGTRLLTGETGQAEIEFEDGSVVRVAANSTVTLDAMRLSEGAARSELSVLNGVAYFELRQAPGFSYRVSAEDVSATPTENAVLRVDLDAAKQGASFAVLTGTVEVSGAEGLTVRVGAGETLRGNPEDPAKFIHSSEIEDEPSDAWNQSRDELAASEANGRTAVRDGYAGSQGFGWSDLDANGTWYAAPADDSGGQAQVWQPNEADAGDPNDPEDYFDPYGYGNFVWTGGSYVFASAYPWGWTPFRCGRWDWYAGVGWAWRPDRFCRIWGEGGGRGVYVGKGPPNYKTSHLPIRKPGKPRPVIPVQAPGQPRVAIQHVGALKLSGVVYRPVSPTAPVLSPTILGQALYRDYPVNRETREPVFGVVTGAGPWNPAGVISSMPRPGYSGRPAGVPLPGEAAHHRGNATEPKPAAPGHPAPAGSVPAPRSAPAPAPAATPKGK